jgi:hypothetical protein
MKTISMLAFAAGLLVAVTSQAQHSPNAQPPSAYDYRVVVQPGMTIDGHRFTPDTVITSVALNDSGQTAFIAHWRDGAGDVGVFSSTHLVADEYTGILGIDSLDFPSEGHLAINAAGQVAFEAIYSQKPDVSERWDGIFVDGQLALRRNLDAVGSPFTLTDDGQVIPGPQKAGAAPARPAPAPQQGQQGKSSLLDQLHMKQPKLPFGITVSPKGPTANPTRPAPDRAGERPPLTNPASPSAAMCTNRWGQVLIPINLNTGGFMLVLGTPINNASRVR